MIVMCYYTNINSVRKIFSRFVFFCFLYRVCVNYRNTMLLVRTLISVFIIILSQVKLTLGGDIETSKKFVILAIDGGGVRGIIPARILQEIELRTGKPIYKMIDLISGNSTGGIICLGLVKPPSVSNFGPYSATELVNLYKHNSKNIFSKSVFWQIKTGKGILGAQYDRNSLDKLLDRYFQDSKFSNALRPAFVFSYSLDKREAHIWSSIVARTSDDHDFYMRDIAGATSAAPTYFTPKKFQNVKRSKNFVEVDGGIYTNNPTILTLANTIRDFPKLKSSDIILISLGTGKTSPSSSFSNLKSTGTWGWVVDANLIDIMLNLNEEITEWESNMLRLNKFYRLQVTIDEQQQPMDNVSEKNIDSLLKTTENYIKENTKTIDEICSILNNNS